MASYTVIDPYCGGRPVFCTACSYDGGLQGSLLSTCLNTSMADKGRGLCRSSAGGSASLWESSWRVPQGKEFSFWESFFTLLLLKAPKLLVRIRTLLATLMDCERLFSSEISLGMSCWAFAAIEGWVPVFALLRQGGDPTGELVKTELSDWLEAALSREEHEQLPAM